MATTVDFYGVGLHEITPSGLAPTTELRDVFHILKPKPSKTRFLRIGGHGDGAYLLPDDLDGVVACFSPGVNRIKYFEDHLADRYAIPSHMCDFTCEEKDFTTPLRPSLQTFAKKWLDVEPGEDNVSLEEWILSHEPSGDLLLQMDIEGAEYRNVLGTPDDILARFRIIVLEVHGLKRMLDIGVLRQAIAPFFNKLAKNFTTVHAHPNNCCGDFAVPGSDIRIPNVLELTLTRNDRFIPGAGPAALPHPLDVSRNVPSKPPLVLSDAWCDYERPLESRVKIIEDSMEYRDDPHAAGVDRQLPATLSLMMQSVQSVAALMAPGTTQARHDDLIEVAEGKPFQLSSAYGSMPTRGVVRSHGNYFFHTDFGSGEWIEVDLGRDYWVSRIEIVNRRDGHHGRARFLFARLAAEGPDRGTLVFPMYRDGDAENGSWRECEIDLPCQPARYVTLTAPMKTALHFCELRVYALRPRRLTSDRSERPKLLHQLRSRLRHRFEFRRG